MKAFAGEKEENQRNEEVGNGRESARLSIRGHLQMGWTAICQDLPQETETEEREQKQAGKVDENNDILSVNLLVKLYEKMLQALALH